MRKYVAYYRVSTTQQGKSGLGLAAQREVIGNFMENEGNLIGEYVEIQSGGKDNREELWKAVTLAKREKANIVIARLDRFSRKVSFISGLMEKGVGLTVAEMPTATDFQLHIFAALAQEERRLISERTKAALKQAKLRGQVLGKNGKVLALRNKTRWTSLRDRLCEAVPDWQVLSYSQLARHLNEMGLETPRGSRFNAAAVRRYLS